MNWDALAPLIAAAATREEREVCVTVLCDEYVNPLILYGPETGGIGDGGDAARFDILRAFINDEQMRDVTRRAMVMGLGLLLQGNPNAHAYLFALYNATSHTILAALALPFDFEVAAHLILLIAHLPEKDFKHEVGWFRRCLCRAGFTAEITTAILMHPAWQHISDKQHARLSEHIPWLPQRSAGPRLPMSEWPLEEILAYGK